LLPQLFDWGIIFVKRAIPLLLGVLLGVVLLVTLATGQVPGVRGQTSNPEGSTLYATGQQGLIFFIYTGIILGGVITNGILIAGVMWWLNRSVKRAKAQTPSAFSFSLNPAKPNSIGAVLVKNPMLVVGGLVTVIVIAALVLVITGAIG